MKLDRDELAARFAVADYGARGGQLDRSARDIIADSAFKMADSFIAWQGLLGASKPALAPPPAEAPDARGEARDNWPAAITEQLRVDGHAESYRAAFVRLVTERVIAARPAAKVTS